MLAWLTRITSSLTRQPLPPTEGLVSFELCCHQGSKDVLVEWHKPVYVNNYLQLYKYSIYYHLLHASISQTNQQMVWDNLDRALGGHIRVMYVHSCTLYCLQCEYRLPWHEEDSLLAQMVEVSTGRKILPS